MHKITIVDTETFKDDRGYLSSLWRNSKLNLHFLEDRLSISTKNVLRGLHGDKITGKLFIPISGRYKEYYEGKITIPYPELNEKFHSVKSAVISEIELQ